MGSGSCDLCARPPGELPAIVHVQQTGGAATFLRACGYCARALRRLGAVSRGLIRLVDGDSGPQTIGPEIGLTDALLRNADLIYDYAEPFVAGGVAKPLGGVAAQGRVRVRSQHDAGVAYRVRAMGAERHDGTWVGWLEFVDPATGRVRRTDRETTQPNRITLVYWASGVQPVYLRGAFDRSREVPAIR
jgi:hypothetical protein